MGANLEGFKDKFNALLQKVSSGDSEFKFPPGQTDGLVALELAPGQYDYIFMFQPEEGEGDRSVEVHLFPSKNPRTMYDEVKESATKPDSWGKVAGWTDSPKGYPNRNDYDDVRLSGLEGEEGR
jgi:hypothetical protein